MTPPAATAAARRRASGARPAGSGRSGPARPARRVSGPARPAPGGAERPIAAFGGRLAASAAAVLPQPLTRPSAPPRRRPVAVPRPARRRSDGTLGARALEWLRALPDHRLLDRLIGGRIWIVLLGTLLVGIVTMQLALLRLNAGIGRAVERGSALEQRNAALRLSISELSDSTRIVASATQMGFVMPPQGSPRFRTASATDPATALRTMRVPDPNAAAVAAAELAATTAAATSMTTAVAGATAAPVDPTQTSSSATTTTTSPTGVAPAAGTTAAGTTTTPAAGTTAPPSTTVAGGASAPTVPGAGQSVGPQG